MCPISLSSIKRLLTEGFFVPRGFRQIRSQPRHPANLPDISEEFPWPEDGSSEPTAKQTETGNAAAGEVDQRASSTDATRRVDFAVALAHCSGSDLPRAVRVQLITLGGGVPLLVSPIPLSSEQVTLKRIAPRFDRKFLECRLQPAVPEDEVGDDAGEQQPAHCYRVEFVGFSDWLRLTNWLYQGLLSGTSHPLPRPSTTVQPPSGRSSRQPEPTLMPLLSAIGLVVVYASNLSW